MLGWLTDAASRLSRAASTTSALPLTFVLHHLPGPTAKLGRCASAAVSPGAACCTLMTHTAQKSTDSLLSAI